MLIRTRRRLVATLALLLLTGPLSLSPAVATEDGGLLAACSEPGTPSDACRFYVAGFLDGALLTDTAIISSLAAVHPEADSAPSDFLARAYQTRVGHLRGTPPPTALAEFCLPPDLTIDDAAREVLLRLDAGPELSLQERVYAAVKARFPCRTP